MVTETGNHSVRTLQAVSLQPVLNRKREAGALVFLKILLHLRGILGLHQPQLQKHTRL